MHHLEFAARESYVSPQDANWSTWLDAVERTVGHDLDGDQQRDGYSIDFAHDAWLAGTSPEDYAAEVAAAKEARRK